MSKYVDDLKRKREVEIKPSSSSSSNNSKKPTSSSLSRIEQLRTERYIYYFLWKYFFKSKFFRLKRETEERTKTATFLSRVFTGNDPTPDATPEPTPIETDDRKRRYNSQFNPDFAKQNTQDFNRKNYS
jgi:hypothetical protein